MLAPAAKKESFLTQANKKKVLKDKIRVKGLERASWSNTQMQSCRLASTAAMPIKAIYELVLACSERPAAGRLPDLELVTGPDGQPALPQQSAGPSSRPLKSCICAKQHFTLKIFPVAFNAGTGRRV